MNSRNEHQTEYLCEVRREILKYKWIESEKAGHDLGNEAIKDWINKFAKIHRREFIQKKLLDAENCMSVIKTSYNLPEGMMQMIDVAYDCIRSVEDNLEIDNITLN